MSNGHRDLPTTVAWTAAALGGAALIGGLVYAAKSERLKGARTSAREAWVEAMEAIDEQLFTVAEVMGRATAKRIREEMERVRLAEEGRRARFGPH